MRVEPSDGAANAILLVLGLDEHVAFMFVDDQLGFDAQRFEGVPEFVGLRGGAFAVAVAHDQSVGVFTFLMKVMGELLA